ncbi:LysR substrate-binding domain-containing protein [Oceanimonas pelagia]|uniref:LysR substrate-binding domain-containing protein n=1 Tax=Oceanimonas pelagia TaxID=3028314 RepID=A0AA50QBT5_9GAMM|nr:LysR substrate-binding domain-containing protein [Oceanimonas pelagia]WMC12353.1 LysR substrate-binding domain-containing protein [Oceanimonas pelagia]
MLTFQQLNAFRAIMLSGTVTEAARQLHISQPAVSRLLAQLEASLGFSLFERHKSRLLATREARAFMAEVDKAFIGLDRLEQAAAGIREHRGEQLVISALPAFSLSLLPQVIARFCRRFEGVSIGLVTHRSADVQARTRATQSDIGFADAMPSEQGLDHIPWVFDCVCLLPENHPLASRNTIAPGDLHGQPLIQLEPHLDPSGRVQHLLAEAGARPLTRIHTSLVASQAGLVAAGAGLALVDPFTAEAARPLGLVSRPFAPAVPFRVDVLFPAFQPRSRLASAFLDETLAWIRERGIVMAGQGSSGPKISTGK